MYTQLISVKQLYAQLNNDNLIILDASMPAVGGAKAAKQGWPHTVIPSARRFDIAKAFSDLTSHLPHTMPNEHYFTQQAQKLGINSNTQIVVYDDIGIFSSARPWWMFKAMGHKNIAVLDGGLPAWLAADLPTSSAITVNYSLGNFVGHFNNNYFCDANEVLHAITTASATVLDARSASRFSGQEQDPRQGVRSGHMPKALNLHYQSLQKDGIMLSKKELKQRFIDVGATKEPFIMSCGSGVTACILALSAEIIGYNQIKVYDGSWSEWGANSNFPISP